MNRAWPLGLALLILAGCADAPTIPQVNPLPEGRLSSGYGTRSVDPVTGEATPNGHHGGYDLAAAMGTPIRAAKAGKVSFVGRKGGYGNTVIVSHAGSFETLYGHASRLAVSLGQEVNAGQILAYVGSTGYSTGPHLHYELRYQGKPVDPGLFTAMAPARPKPSMQAKSRKARAVAAEPTPLPDMSAVKGVSEPPEAAALESLPQDAPPLRYPSDPAMRSAMQALDGSALAPLSPDPPTLWQRLKSWVATVFQTLAARIMPRRST